MASVKELLAKVDYSHDPIYTPSTFALKMINFIKLITDGKGEASPSPVMHYKMLDALPYPSSDMAHQRIANLAARGSSKALALDTLLLTPEGTVTMGEVKVGDTLISRTGLPTKVTHKSELHYKPTYLVTLVDGSTFKACEDHNHVVMVKHFDTMSNGKKKTKYVEKVMTTKEIVESGVTYSRKVTDHTPTGKEVKYRIPLITNPVQFDYGSLPDIDPYTVGVILGDGHISRHTVEGQVSITSHKDDITELMSYIPYKLSDVSYDKRNTNVGTFRIRDLNKLVLSVLGTGRAYEKFIPDKYKYGSVETRIEVLRGLLDTDGTCSPEGISTYCTTSKQLAHDVRNLVKSLGGYAKIKHYDNDYRGYYIVTIRMQNMNPFKLSRKSSLWIPNREPTHIGKMNGIWDIQLVPTEATQCLTVDCPSHTFLLEDSTITHNTSVFAEILFFYIGVFNQIDGFGDVDAIIYVSDTVENGVRSLKKNMEARYQASDFLKQYIPEAVFNQNEIYFTNVDGKRTGIRMFGAQSGIRGTKIFAKRPQLAVLDDLLSDKNAKSEGIIQSILDTVYKGVDQALDPTQRKIIFSGTPFNQGDPLYMAIESGAWIPNVYPICEKFPCTKEEFRGSWPERFSYEFILSQYSTAKEVGQLDSFYQELMLEINSQESNLVEPSDINWYSRKNLFRNKHTYHYYITTDFATSEAKTADNSSISVWAINSHGHKFWVDGVLEPQTMDVNIDDLFSFVVKYNPLAVGVETNGQQGGFIPWIKQEMVNRNIFFTLAKSLTDRGKSSKEGIHSPTNKTKLERFNLMLPEIKAGKLWLPLEMKDDPIVKEILTELYSTTRRGILSRRDDWLDSYSMLNLMNVVLPAETHSYKDYNDERDELYTKYWMKDDGHSSMETINTYIV